MKSCSASDGWGFTVSDRSLVIDEDAPEGYVRLEAAVNSTLRSGK